MSGHCPGCGIYHEEDDDRACANCSKDARIARLQAEVKAWREADLYGDMTGTLAGDYASESAPIDSDGIAHRDAVRAARNSVDTHRDLEGT